MQLYQQLHIDLLEEIQHEALKRIPADLLDKTTLTYIDNNREIFSSIPALKEYLIRTKVYSHLGPIAVNITLGRDAGNYHVDNGIFSYSLNIPVMGCADTWINFYETTSEPHVVTVKNKGETHNFLRFHPDECKLIRSDETNSPYLLHVKTPHRVENKSDGTRVMLLLRLLPSFNPGALT
jgi:hypothetical protein